MTVPIDYAPPRPPARRWVRRAAVATALAAAAVVGQRYGPIAWRQARVLYRQHQCLTYALPADRVVYEEGPAASAALVAGGRAAWYSRPLGVLLTKMVGQIAPPPAAVVTADCWVAFGREVPVRPYPDGATLFCHERRSAAGARRLVVVQLAPVVERLRFIPGLDVQTALFDPATLTRHAVLQPFWLNYSGQVFIDRTPAAVRIYAGQADPADAAHFTIRYEMWGVADVVDGRLSDDGTRVRLTPRHPPVPPAGGE